MIEKLKYLYVGALALATAGFVACDESEEELNGWTDTSYVYVLGETLGNGLGMKYLVVEREGLVDPTPATYTFQVCLNRAVSADVTVGFETEISGGSADDALDNTVVLNSANVTIPAGELKSEPIEMTINPEFLAVTDEVREYDPTNITVKLTELVTKDASVRLSTKTNKVTVKCAKEVTPFKNLWNGIPENAEIMSFDTWTMLSYTGFIGIWDDDAFFNPSNVTVGKLPSEAVFDMGMEVTVLGGHHKCGYNAPTQIEIETSLDNVTWETNNTLGIESTLLEDYSRIADWKMKIPVRARYLKYRVTSPKSSVVATVEIYIPKQ